VIRGVLDNFLNVLKAIEDKKTKEEIEKMGRPHVPSAHTRERYSKRYGDGPRKSLKRVN
jgi:hypothetical protein